MRCVGSSQADPFSAGAAATAALYGPLHGGANEVVVRLLTEIGTVANILSRFVSMTAARVGGLLGVALVVGIGNPWAAWRILQEPATQWRRWPFDGVMWKATRIIPVSDVEFAISEFPAFSFLFADVHPHVMAMPFVISALGLGWNTIDYLAGSPACELVATGPVTSTGSATSGWMSRIGITGAGSGLAVGHRRHLIEGRPGRVARQAGHGLPHSRAGDTGWVAVYRIATAEARAVMDPFRLVHLAAEELTIGR